MKKIRLKKGGIERLNLIPIMDAVFIFIFYLLMSAQFIEIHQVTTDVAKSESVEKAPKKALQLKVKANLNTIEVFSGLEENKIKTFANDGSEKIFVEISHFLHSLKKDNPTEKTVIVSLSTDVKYETMIKVMESVKEIKIDAKKIELFPSIALGE